MRAAWMPFGYAAPRSVASSTLSRTSGRMSLDLPSLVAPGHTALVTQECQRGVIGDLSALPALAAAAQGEMIANVAALVDAARRAGVRVIHCTAERRPHRRGAHAHARIFQYMARSAVKLHPGSPAAQLVPEIE